MRAWEADPLRALAQLGDVLVRIGVRCRRQKLTREPEHALGLVHFHQLLHYGLEVGEDLDLCQSLERGSNHD